MPLFAVFGKGRTIIFSPGGIVIGKKIVCMRKNAEINCLLQGCIWQKIVCRDHLFYARFGEFEKNCLHSRSGGKKLASAQSMVEKNFLPLRNHDTPWGKNNGPPLRFVHFM